MFERAILHLDLDSFFVSVETLKNSSLKGQPLIIGGKSPRGVVSSCSDEARLYGVHAAMPLKLAMRLCPQAEILHGDVDNYHYYSQLVTEVIAHDAPFFEKASIKEFYLDLTGMDKHFGCYKWSLALRSKIINETGLPVSFGLSVNKLVSKVGTGESKPEGTIEIQPGMERDFLAPLKTHKIPGVGIETYKRLSFMGVRTVQVLREIPLPLLVREFGKQGIQLWERANAIDRRPVVPYTEQKSLSREHTFDQDTLDMRIIRTALLRLADELSFELRAQNKLSSLITIKIRYADLNTYSSQKRIPFASSPKSISKYALDIFEALYQRRQFIRMVGVKFGGLVSGNHQISLFEDTVEEINLLQEMDRIRRRFGKDAIGSAALM